MRERDRWKTVLAYMVGIGVLVLALILAWFLPGWYSQWQDERLMGQVTVSSRENIEFLDSDSLDIAGRLEKLGMASSLSWGSQVDYSYFDYGYDGWISEGQQSAVSRCKTVISQWWDAGMLPVDCRDWVDEEHALILMEYVLYVDQNALPVCFMAFSEWAYGQEETEEDLNLLMVLMDAEKDLIYYASVAGPEVCNAMAKELGYESNQHLVGSLEVGLARIRQELDLSGYDFASVCGAESAEITSDEGQLELKVSLQFDHFEGYAGRSLICNEAGYGMAVMYGTAKWPKMMQQLLENYGSFEWLMTTDLWCDFIVGGVDYGQAEEILSEIVIEGDTVNDEVFTPVTEAAEYPNAWAEDWQEVVIE